MDSWRGSGHAEDPARDSAAETPASMGAAVATEWTWAPAETSSGMVSMDERQFEALVRPLREAGRTPSSAPE